MQMTYEFDTDSNFDLTNTQIQSAVGKLAIVNNPGQVFSQPFTSDSGFTYDSAKAEFTGGLVRQKDQRPSNSLIAATYTALKSLNWSQGGSLTATDIGTPVLSAGKLQCHGGGNNAVRYENADIGSEGNTGAFKIKYTPNYSGTPAANYNIFEFAPVSGNNDRMLVLHSASGGTLRFTAYTSVGTIKHTAVAFGAAWSPVAGTTYELELNWDTVAGVVRLFVDGVLQGAMPVSSYARGTDADRLYIGAGTVYTATDASFDDPILFNTVQHTSNYTPGYTVPETSYAANIVSAPAFTYTGLGTIVAVESSTVTETGSPRYTVNDLYWNGSAWVSSNGTYAQANDSATIIANLTSLNVTGATSVPFKVYFTDSNTQSSVDLVSITVTGQKYSPTGSIVPIQPINVQAISAYTQTEVIPGSTELKIILIVDGVDKYWNGSAWVNSNGLIAQANTEAEVNTNIAALSLGSNSTVFIKWMMATSDNTATPEISLVVVTFDFGGIETVPDTVLIWGYYKDISKQPVAGATVTFTLKRTAKEYKEAASNIIEQSVSTTTDANGYFEVDLIRSSEYEGEGVYIISITKADASLETSQNSGKQPLEFSAPDADEKDITDLLEAS